MSSKILESKIKCVRKKQMKEKTEMKKRNNGQWIHKSIRLSCDIARAYRFFTRKDVLEKSSGHVANIDLKKEGSYTISDKDGEWSNRGTVIFSFEREKHLFILWKDSLFPKEVYKANFYFMPCRSDTEYCTEIHLVFCNENRPLTQEENTCFSNRFGNWMEDIRKHVNGDWIIQDKDLSLSWLRGSDF